MKNFAIALAAAAAAATVSVPAAASTLVQVYNAPDGLVGNQDWAGTLGLNFTVNQATSVSMIGVFDSGSNGLSANLFATIFDSSGTALFTPVAFASGTASSGSAYIFKPISVNLAPGTYQLAAWGYNSAEPNYNYGFVQGGNGGPITFNSAGGRLTAVSTSYSSVAGDFATIPDNGNTRYGAGSLVVAVPEPATWAMMLVGFGMIGFGLRSRRKQSVRVTYA